ncbi:hypothetical protein TVNIR_3289 [Thioalkalivibrio nitratireducens DSM 14787]|uniref:Uncharacterized protein n=2 Tax=Thioalkalivibrio nitratireducens TaxID=186931 RepID=L0E2S9_THIND|nr:hypothetical protein TVNIR_3289 [Thioalkalivibrio nitratireducens DSM 14787]
MVTVDEDLHHDRQAALARLEARSMHIRVSSDVWSRWDWDALRREALYNPDNRFWIAAPC